MQKLPTPLKRPEGELFAPNGIWASASSWTALRKSGPRLVVVLQVTADPRLSQRSPDRQLRHAGGMIIIPMAKGIRT